ncbi:glycosyltransferase family 2 protein [Oscillatoria sp. FACHB-1406]|uniref:glycosyltransferase family 2 protein n=1 Tax=Oscillatoria sp. FACHB-1406 TaxID=2692846 RepID=UPI001687FAF7|nr:glycosyltransferase family 2 protein [Oscillatoria sp. FACHB-1406]MBD2579015.1 glycosyltransferase family 2 protein [Oscillatoria sp. FACHB-1406]
MKFSIVITTYNRLPLLQRAIRTALSQSIPCETIVIDDGSSDGTQEYTSALSQELKDCDDGRLVYHRNETNLGHSRSVNLGVELATGDWIKLVDDDDYLAPNCIEEMQRAIALRPQAALCSCQAIQVDDEEGELSRTQSIGPGKVFYIPQEDIHYGMLLEQVPFGTPVQVAFRRDAFLKTGGWDSSLDANFDDIDSWVKIAQFGDAVFINQCLAYRTIWSGSFNQKFSLPARFRTNLAIKQKIYAFVSEKYRDEIPSLETLENYLKLHWGLVALKHARWRDIVLIAWPAIASPAAWNLLLARANRAIDTASIRQLEAVPTAPEVLELFQQIELKRIKLLRNQTKQCWGLTALQEGRILPGVRSATSALLSQEAWKLLMASTLPQTYPQYGLSQKQIEANNLAAMQRIYELVSSRYHDQLPPTQEMEVHLRWRLFGQAVKSRKLVQASRFLLPALLSPVAWKTLKNIGQFRKSSTSISPVRKFVLVGKE